MKAIIGSLVLCLAGALAADATAAPPPPTIRVQGALRDRSVGTPVPADGTFQMTFRLYDAPVGGNLVATSGPGPVQVTGGLYNTDVSFPLHAFDLGNLFLEVQIGAETLTPRMPVVSVPYAYVAAQSGSVAPGGVTSASIAPGAVTPDKLAPCPDGQILAHVGGSWACHSVPAACIPGDFLNCYDGPPGTLGQGVCAAGVRTCDPSGTWMACQGEVLPSPEVCGNPIDENCDGVIDGQHSSGLGQFYYSCVPFGVPGDPSTYTEDMALAAANAANFGNITGSILCGATAVQEFNSAQKRCAIWEYQGPLAGHVRLDTSGTCSCPTASDPTWN